jgi:hypothetical protein
MATADGGLVTVAYGPNEVHTRLKGTAVSIREETSYPFRGNVQLTLHLQAPAAFPIVLRIPDWATGATIKVNGQPATAASDHVLPNRFFPITRDWKNGDVVSIAFPMEPRVEHSYHESVVIERGPLVFALPLEGAWKEIKHYAQTSGDWQVEPSRPWNYGLEVGNCDAAVEEHPVTDVPFDVTRPAVAIKVRGKQLPEWTSSENSAGPLPMSPVSSKEPLESLTLVPYGAAKVRITAFPFLDRPSHCTASSAAITSGR